MGTPTITTTEGSKCQRIKDTSKLWKGLAPAEFSAYCKSRRLKRVILRSDNQGKKGGFFTSAVSIQASFTELLISTAPFRLGLKAGDVAISFDHIRKIFIRDSVIGDVVSLHCCVPRGPDTLLYGYVTLVFQWQD